MIDGPIEASRSTPTVPATKELAWWRPLAIAGVHVRISSALFLDLSVVALSTAIGLFIGGIEVGSGDYGQWLMVSRSYLGLDVPAYRDVAGVPLLTPLLLAWFQRVIPDPLVAVQAFKGVLAAAFVLSLYLAGTGIFGRRTAGLLTAVLGFLVTDRFLEPFAFGGLPQTLSLTFTALGMAAFGFAGTRPRFEWRWWTLGALAIGGAGLSHVGTGLIAAGAGGISAFVSTWRVPSLPLHARAAGLLPVAVAIALLALYWRFLLPVASMGYASNPASLNYRGPELVWSILRSYNPTLLVIWLGAASLMGGILDEVAQRKVGGFLVAAAWGASAWGLFVYSMLAGAGTDYPRFIPPMLTPLAVAAGGGLALLLHGLASTPRLRRAPSLGFILPVALAGVLAVGFGPRTMARHQAETQGYSLSDKLALVETARWLEVNLVEDASVLAPTREGKWIEGLTGRAALFEIPVRFSFRPSERARSVAAEALVRSTAALTNEYFFVKFTASKLGPVGPVPRDPWIGMNHRGEFIDIARLPSADARVFASDEPNTVMATLGNLAPVRSETVEGPDDVRLTTVWQGQRKSSTVTYTRTTSLHRQEPRFDMVDEVTTGAPLDRLVVRLRTMADTAPTAIELTRDQVDIYLAEAGGSQPHLRITAPGQQVEFEEMGDGILVRTLGSGRLHLRFEAISAGRPISELGLLTPESIVSRFAVGAIVFKASPALEARVQRLAAIGFSQGFVAGPYVVLVREGAREPG